MAEDIIVDLDGFTGPRDGCGAFCPVYSTLCTPGVVAVVAVVVVVVAVVM